MHYKHMILLVKNLKFISLQNIRYYPNHWYKSYITSLKAVIIGKSLISAALDIYRILHFVFYDKILQIYWQHWVRKFYRHILSKYRQISKKWVGEDVTAPRSTRPGLQLSICCPVFDVINFAINLSFYTKPAFLPNQKVGGKIQISQARKEILTWNKIIFYHLKFKAN